MFEKLTDILREVFWLKKAPKKRRAAVRKAAPKKAPKKSPKPVKKAAAKPAAQPKAAPKPPKAVKPAKPAAVKAPKKPLIDPSLVKTGEITHYFDRIKVAVLKITQGTILIGDRLTIAAKPSPFVQKVWSMQIESQDVKVAKKGQLIGLKIDKPAAVGDIVYK